VGRLCCLHLWLQVCSPLACCLLVLLVLVAREQAIALLQQLVVQTCFVNIDVPYASMAWAQSSQVRGLCAENAGHR